MSEGNFRSRLKDKADDAIQSIYWMPVENSAGKSMPDQHFLNAHGFSGWVELKFVQEFTHQIKFQIGQARWLGKYWRRGGASYVAVHCKSTDGLYIFNGCDAVELEEQKHMSSNLTRAFWNGSQKDKQMIEWLCALQQR